MVTSASPPASGQTRYSLRTAMAGDELYQLELLSLVSKISECEEALLCGI